MKFGLDKILNPGTTRVIQEAERGLRSDKICKLDVPQSLVRLVEVTVG